MRTRVGSASKKKQNQLSGTMETLTAERQMPGFSKEATRLPSFLKQKIQCLGQGEQSCFSRYCQTCIKRCQRMPELMQTSSGDHVQHLLRHSFCICSLPPQCVRDVFKFSFCLKASLCESAMGHRGPVYLVSNHIPFSNSCVLGKMNAIRHRA